MTSAVSAGGVLPVTGCNSRCVSCESLHNRFAVSLLPLGMLAPSGAASRAGLVVILGLAPSDVHGDYTERQIPPADRLPAGPLDRRLELLLARPGEDGFGQVDIGVRVTGGLIRDGR